MVDPAETMMTSPANAEPGETLEEALYSRGIPRAAVKPSFNEEEKYASKIAWKRHQAAMRKPRILNAKFRTIGLDTETLDLQVVEKQQLKELESVHDKAYDGLCISVEKQLKLLEVEKRRHKLEMEKECKEFSIQNLSFTQRREYDLNNKNALKEEKPCRIGDDDPRCTIGSMQQFEGEDLEKRERVQRQMEQQGDWIEQQIFEKKMRGGGHKDEESKFADQIQSITTLRNEIEEREDVLRKNLGKAQQTFNTQQAAVREGVKRNGAAVENVLNFGEMAHHAQDPFLNEQVQAYNDSNGRIRRGEYKGIGREVKVDCQATQLAQIAERSIIGRQDKTADRIFANQSEGTRRQLLIMELEKQRNQKAAAKAVLDENRKLAAAATEQQKNLKDNVYRNHCAPGYFEQFGTSAR